MLLFLSSLLYGQNMDYLSSSKLTVDFGSFRNRYFYPITNIKYNSALLKKANIKFSVRLRSYGTLFFFSKNAYDISPIAEYYITKTAKPVSFSAGIGLDARIRLVNDERSDVTSSVEPLVSMTLSGGHRKILYNIPLWSRFYSNGVSFAIFPAAYYRLGNKFSIFIRYELSYLTIYMVSAHEWRRDIFIGTQIMF